MQNWLTGCHNKKMKIGCQKYLMVTTQFEMFAVWEIPLLFIAGKPLVMAEPEAPRPPATCRIWLDKRHALCAATPAAFGCLAGLVVAAKYRGRYHRQSWWRVDVETGFQW